MLRHLSWIALGMLLLGCSRGEPVFSTREATRSADFAVAHRQATPASPGTASNAGSFGGLEAAPPADLKVIHNATLELVTPKFSELEAQLPLLVRQAQGYVAESNSNQNQGQRTSGTWVVRIPTGAFDGFLQKLAGLGTIESRQVAAEEVTAEYVDLEARIVNKQKMEQRVLEIIGQRSGPLAEVMQLEGELARIREEVERMQGRLRLLANQTSLATVRISAHEEQNYIPRPEPTFAERLDTTWKGTLSRLTSVGAAVLLTAVALGPWLVVGMPLAALALVSARRLARSRVFAPVAATSRST